MSVFRWVSFHHFYWHVLSNFPAPLCFVYLCVSSSQLHLIPVSLFGGHTHPLLLHPPLLSSNLLMASRGVAVCLSLCPSDDSWLCSCLLFGTSVAIRLVVLSKHNLLNCQQHQHWEALMCSSHTQRDHSRQLDTVSSVKLDMQGNNLTLHCM